MFCDIFCLNLRYSHILLEYLVTEGVVASVAPLLAGPCEACEVTGVEDGGGGGGQHQSRTGRSGSNHSTVLTLSPCQVGLS